MSVDLMCFPFAGAGAGVYRPWCHRPSDVVRVVPVQLPGREEAFLDPVFRTVQEATTACLDTVTAALGDGPFALFGHSYGAVLAYEVALHLTRRGRPPVRLFVSGAPGPLDQRRGESYRLADDELVARVEDLAGYRHEALADPDLRELLLPALRSDLELHETYLPSSTEPLPVPVTALRGSADALVPRDTMAGWAAATRAGYELVELDGGHMYFLADVAPLWSVLEETLAGHAATPVRVLP